MPSVVPDLPPDISAPGQAASQEGRGVVCSDVNLTVVKTLGMDVGPHPGLKSSKDSVVREHMLPIGEPLFAISMGPVPKNSDCKVLCPMRPRAILPHDCDQRYGRDEYPSDVSDSDCEGSIYIVKKKKNLNRRTTLDPNIIPRTRHTAKV